MSIVMGPSVMRRSVHRLHRALPTLYINKLEILNGKITLTLKHPEKSHSKSLLLDNSTDEIFYQGEKKIRRAINESNLSKKLGKAREIAPRWLMENFGRQFCRSS